MNIFSWQTNLWQSLLKRCESMPHGLLFRGPRGIGKSEFALALSAAMLCRQPQSNGLACASCASCLWVSGGNHPDFRLVQPEAASAEGESEAPVSSRKPSKMIRVEQVRELGDWLSVGAHQGGYRVAVIQPAEAMNSATANALLKTLEEPPAGTILLLVSHEPDRLLPTIRSRCQSIDFSLPPRAAALAWMESVGIEAPAVALDLAGGAPLAARDRAESTAIGTMLVAALSDPRLDPLLLATQLQTNPLPDVIDLLQRWTIDLAHAAAGLPVRYHQHAAQSIERAGRGLRLVDLLGYHRRLIAARRVAEHPLAPRLVLEELFVEYAQLRRNHA